MEFNFSAFDLTEQQQSKLEEGLKQHGRYSALKFRVLAHDSESITIRIEQGKTFHGNAKDSRELSDIAKEFFSEFSGGRKIHTRPMVHRSSPVDIVTPRWIKEQMQIHGVRNKDLVEAFGVGKAEISNYINGKKVMGQTTRSAFYYYFKSLE